MNNIQKLIEAEKKAQWAYDPGYATHHLLALGTAARNAMPEIVELVGLYREYFDARSMPTAERRAAIVDRIREIVGEK